MIDRLRRLLASRRVPLVVALLAVVLFAPTLGAGYVMDDHIHRISFRPESRALGGPWGDWDIFRFQDADRGHLRRSMDLGTIPWWTAPDFRLAFLRPLASLHHALDYRLWPDAPAVMHAENIALFAILALLAAAIYRRALGATTCAGLAALMFAIDDAHAFGVTWIANRNALWAAVFGFAALWAHDRWRRDGWAPGAALGPAAYALGMLSAEAAAATLAYLFAHAVWLDRGGLLARARVLSPYAAIAIVWAIAYRALGYGAAAGGLYVDPVHEPAAYIAAACERLPVFLLAQLTPVPSSLWIFVPEQHLAAALAVVVALVGLVAAALWAGVPRDRMSGFFATGAVLSLLPACATWPNDRLLLFSGLGAFGLIASVIAASREALGPGARRVARGAAAAMVAFHLVLAPLLLIPRSLSDARVLGGLVRRAAASLPPEAEMADHTLVVVNAPDTVAAGLGVTTRFIQGERTPAAIRQIAVTSRGTLRILRTDERTLDVTLSDGFFHNAMSNIHRTARSPMRAGERVELSGMTATVLSLTPDGSRPQRVEFRFERPLDDPGLVWVTWIDTRFERFEVPPVGGERVLSAIDLQKAFAGK
ncbi:uncharacterized protein SOCE26_058890 [Sorangium cellulosum]|uniref:Glycosyltransferase RgtA/B/C/D-like domain-containing protein n=1 Tax=Sorangium cellulosum TaxID=56 RepID=A0A2L0EYS6_SORCE|nr:hypothetical protein [Sorangium cellulosum]AUX44425.1 uncharacterized protein SOCE26_058890 [Sorangium cellulosum]